MTTTNNLLLELLVEELPPKALPRLSEAFSSVLLEQLQAQGLASASSNATAFATPRRLGVHISAVAQQGQDQTVTHKLMPASVGLDAQGQATAALLKKLQTLGADASAVPHLLRQGEGKAQVLLYPAVVKGLTLAQGLQQALEQALAKLPVPKMMSYQLSQACELPGWTSVSFVRPAHSLLALYGADVVPVSALGLQAGRTTQGHRFEAQTPLLEITHADQYATQLQTQGAVIANFATRRAEIERQLLARAQQASQQAGLLLHPIQDAALLDEVCALVERPQVLLCQFEPQFLQVPQECLILTMKANQKYFPLLDAQERLSHYFLVVSNINPDDPSAVIAGNERVVRPRLADAQFFYQQDRKKPLAARTEGLAKVVYHNQLGSQGERVQRLVALATYLGQALGSPEVAQQAARAAYLAKADLLTDMVGEFPELQGTMGAYYARHDGEPEAVAQAIEDHYRPRFAGDDLPRHNAGLALALADKLDTLVGLFSIGQTPSGEKDPFALRRHALGILRMVLERELPLALNATLAQAWDALGTRPTQAKDSTLAATRRFIEERLSGYLREQGFSAQEIDAVLALAPEHLAEVPKRLAAVRAFAALPEAQALAAANKRVTNILKKAELAPDAQVLPQLLRERAEQELARAVAEVAPQAQAALARGDYQHNLRLLAQLKAPVDAFFADVMVNSEDAALRTNRLALLAQLQRAMNQVADLSRLAAG